MIKLTEQAARQVQHSLTESKSEGMSLRLAAKINTEGTYEYGMGFDNEKDDDIKISSSGIDIVIAPQCRELLEDAVLDFVETEEGKQEFIFFNPNDPDHKQPK